MFVGAGDFFYVLRGDVGLLGGSFLGDTGAQNFRLRLEVDDEVGLGQVCGDSFIVAFVEF